MEQITKNVITENYGKLTYDEIGTKVGMSGRMVRYYARKKLGLRKLKNNQIWTEKEIQLLKNEYHRKSDIYELFPNRSVRSVWYKAFDLGLKAKGRGFIKGNYKFFDNWSPTMSYVLGLICADGNIYKNVLTIVQKDFDYLSNLKNIIGWNNIKVRTFKSGVSYIAIRNEYMTDQLHNLNIPEKKSLILDKIPVPEKFMVNFILGYFDGDGCFCNTKSRNKPSTDASMLGTYNFLNWISSEIHKLTYIPRMTVRRQNKKSKIFKLKYSSKDHIYKLFTWLYDNNDFYLERKYQKFQDFLRIRCGNIPSYNTQTSLIKDDDIVQ